MIPKFLEGKFIPKHMEVAYSLLGVKEVEGAANNPVIMGFAKMLGLEKIYKADIIPWCGLFFAYVMKTAGREVVLNTKDKYDYLRALKFQSMPNVTKVPIDQASFGDVLIFQRPEGGHIGFYTGQNVNAFKVLGGNQGNAVSEVLIAKNRCVCVLRPNYINFKPFTVHIGAGGKLSTNEA